MSAILLSLSLLGAAAEVQTRETPTTRLFVQTTPSGATIKLDGKAEGTAPKVFVVPPGATKRIEFQLEPKQAKVSAGLKAGDVFDVEIRQAPQVANQGWTEIERILYADLSGKECGIDLDKGKLYALPKEYDRVVYPREEIERWARDQGIDLFYPAQPAFSAPTGVQLVLLMLDDTTWETLTRKDINDFFTRLGTGGMEVPPTFQLFEWGTSPVYAFITNEGSRGVLQVVGGVRKTQDENGAPLGIRIRYRIERPKPLNQDNISGDELKGKPTPCPAVLYPVTRVHLPQAKGLGERSILDLASSQTPAFSKKSDSDAAVFWRMSKGDFGH